MPRVTRAVSRKDFLRLSGAGLAGAALLGTTGCGGGQGLDVPELFRTVLVDVSKSTEIGALGYNIDVLTPQNFNEVMWSGFQKVLNGSKSPAEQAQALQETWAAAKKQGKPAAQG